MRLSVKHFNELTAKELYEIYKLRVAVFVVEQTCPYQEVDEEDLEAYHVTLSDASGILAYLRVLNQDPITGTATLGRVLSVKRRMGLGTRIVREGIAVAREKFMAKTIVLEAQTYARGLYEKLGFRQISDAFLEDGIPHIKMRLDLKNCEK